MGTKALKPLRILFFGTPDFAVVCLRSLVTHNKTVVGVITSPDRPAGRGKKMRSSVVKNYALEVGLPVFQPSNLKDSSFIETLTALQADVGIVVAFRMLPKVVWSLPKLGTFNLHASLLPDYRGAAPINWVLANGEKETGVTTFFIDEAIDTGAILLQKKIKIAPGETAGTLHDRLAELGSALVLETLEGLKKKELHACPQNNQRPLKKAPKLTKENTRIRWNQTLDALVCFVRAMNPYPGAWTQLIQKEETIAIKIYAIRICKEAHAIPSGTLVVKNKEMWIAHPQGWVLCDALQLPNKKRMAAADLLNGYEFEPGAQVF
ncbi:MAG: methionyl-tRNA formyltransferase [Flavobacteriaceae bacterium]